MVIWLIGISGAGKTTLGNKINNHLKSNGKKCSIIDGDEVRKFYNNDLGYSKNDRISNIKRIMLSVYFLEKNDIISIVCNISPFQFLRDFAREKFNDYNEIYLQKNIQIAKKNDIKEIYKNNLNKTSIVGIDLNFEQPKNSDITINVDNESEEESFQKIIDYINKKLEKDVFKI
ncbi:MAG: adenylyl-sulfate kinase [Campylobacterota bacterium]|nr:adenylyl-sulfate kinase [Campylobacterota bacterium]